MLTTGCSLQPYLPAGAAASPVILATDKTQLTQFLGNKSAYPIYLTLGNIPRAIRYSIRGACSTDTERKRKGVQSLASHFP